MVSAATVRSFMYGAPYRYDRRCPDNPHLRAGDAAAAVSNWRGWAQMTGASPGVTPPYPKHGYDHFNVWGFAALAKDTRQLVAASAAVHEGPERVDPLRGWRLSRYRSSTGRRTGRCQDRTTRGAGERVAVGPGVALTC